LNYPKEIPLEKLDTQSLHIARFESLEPDEFGNWK
jgi:hypothetical protein